MYRIDNDTLSLHLKVSLSGSALGLLGGLADPDRYRGHAAVADLARHLAERLGSLDIRDDTFSRLDARPSLFADLSPLE